MKAVTVASDTNRLEFHLLKASCSVEGVDLVCLSCDDSKYSGNLIKDELLLEYLEEVDSDELILFTDAYDTTFVGSEAEILEKYSRFEKEVVFSAEVASWPDSDAAKRYDVTGDNPYRFLNCGGYIGPAGLIKELLLSPVEKECSFYPESNQYGWVLRYFENRDRIAIDTNCELFCTFCPEPNETLEDVLKQIEANEFAKRKRRWFADNFEVKDGRVYNKITGTWPCHLHFNGGSKFLLLEQFVGMVVDKIPSSRLAEFRRYNLDTKENVEVEGAAL